MPKKSGSKPSIKSKASASFLKSTVHLKSRLNEYDAKARNLKPNDCLVIFNNSLKSYQTDHPHWHLEALVFLIKWGIKNLKCLIEKPGGKITWDNPLVELLYPVQWDWKSPRVEGVVHGKQILGHFTKENTADFQTLIKTISEMMAAHFNVLALGHFTNGAWFEIHNSTSTPYLPVEFDAMLKKIEDNSERHAMAEEVFRPFSIGAARLDTSGSKLRKNAQIPKKIAERLKTSFQQIDIPGVSFNGIINGRQIWAGLVFEIHPLIIDCDKHKAYHAITIGLAFEHKLIGGKLVSLTPSKWAPKEQNAFWDKIIESLNNLAEELIPKDELQASIIMKDHEGLEIVRKNLTLNQIEEAKKWITEFGEANEKQLQQRSILEQLLKAVENAKTPNEKGKSLEELVAGFFGGIPGFSLNDKRTKTETEEMDLVFTNGSDDPKLKREEAIILVECKNWSKNCGKNELVEFLSKMENRKGRCSLGFLISWNGFAETFTKEMLRGSRDRILVVPVDGKQIQEAVQNGCILDAVKSAWDNAIML